MKIGIIGGSFNPPHNSHIEMGKLVLKNKLVDKVIYVPTGDKYGKKGLLDGTYRYEMLVLATTKYPNIEVSDYEIKKGASYTFETLDYFKEQYPNDEIYFILSTDLILDIATWKKSEYILSHYHLIGLKRKGIKEEKLPDIYRKYPDSLKQYDFPMDELSSTFIREEIKKKNFQNLKKYMDLAVLEYIKNNHFYQ